MLDHAIHAIDKTYNIQFNEPSHYYNTYVKGLSLYRFSNLIMIQKTYIMPTTVLGWRPSLGILFAIQLKIYIQLIVLVFNCIYFIISIFNWKYLLILICYTFSYIIVIKILNIISHCRRTEILFSNDTMTILCTYVCTFVTLKYWKVVQVSILYRFFVSVKHQIVIVIDNTYHVRIVIRSTKQCNLQKQNLSGFYTNLKRNNCRWQIHASLVLWFSSFCSGTHTHRSAVGENHALGNIPRTYFAPHITARRSYIVYACLTIR